jgi:predicted CoA-binding protein
MTRRAAVKDFLAERTLARVGLSRDGRAVSRAVYQDLTDKGYRVYPVNPNAEMIEGERCYPSVAALPEKVSAALFFTPPAETENAVREALAAGVKHIWLQPGAESAGALQACAESSVNTVSSECILMFAEPAALPHRLHRWIWGLAGKLPR